MKIRSKFISRLKATIGGQLHSWVSCMTAIEWMIIISIIGILAAVAVPLFSSPDIYAGKVYDKKFTPAYSTTTMIMAGKVMVPSTTHHPDSWRICIEGQEGEERLTACFPTPKHVYDKTNIGEMADFNGS